MSRLSRYRFFSLSRGGGFMRSHTCFSLRVLMATVPSYLSVLPSPLYFSFYSTSQAFLGVARVMAQSIASGTVLGSIRK